MLTPGTRSLILLVSFITGIVCLWNGRYLWAAPCFALGAWMIYGYARYGTVRLAYHAARSGDTARAMRLLQMVRRPERLSAQSLAYYLWIRGAVEADHGNLEEARGHLLGALNGPLRSSNDRCVVACTLAQIELKAGNATAAGEFLERAKTEAHGPAADAVIQEIEKKIEGEAKD